MPAHQSERAIPQRRLVEAVPLKPLLPPFSIDRDADRIMSAERDYLGAGAGHERNNRALAVIEGKVRTRVRFDDARIAALR
jgi:hypothetical protein